LRLAGSVNNGDLPYLICVSLKHTHTHARTHTGSQPRPTKLARAGHISLWLCGADLRSAAFHNNNSAMHEGYLFSN